MTKFRQLLYNKLTLGLVLSTLASLVYAVLLKFSLEHLFDISPIKGGLTIIDLSFFLSIAGLKILFSTLLEAILGEKFYTPIGGYINDSNSIISKMDKDESSAINKGSSSGSSSNSSDNVSDTSEYDKLFKQVLANLDRQYDMVKKLRDLKNSNDLKYYINKGALELDVPARLSDAQVDTLTKQVGIIDRIYNTKYSEYKSLIKEDSGLGKTTGDLRLTVKNAYEGLFEK